MMLISLVVLLASTSVAFIIARAREASKVDGLFAALSSTTLQAEISTVDFSALGELPPPVLRYFRHVLTDGQHLIRDVRIQQSGKLRTGLRTEKWLPFTATQLVIPSAIGFVWNAKINTPLSTHVCVLDSYIAGTGSGRASLLSALSLAAEAGSVELNSGALHRYLAEAVWFPTALLPQSGVKWSAIDDYSALATLTDKGTTVSLEFRFNDVGEVISIYTPGRFGKFDGGYRQTPWEGHFRDYQIRGGINVPMYGEVGWYDDSNLQLVWQGQVDEIQFEFAQ